MSSIDLSSTVAVYSAVQEAKKLAASAKKGTTAAALAPIQSYDLYKVAREEELAAYRGLCRVLVMHHGSELPKSASRILEDLRETLCISDERGALELESAQRDPVTTGVESSGILSRRADFFDGVDDVELVEFARHGAMAVDDDHAVVVMAAAGGPPTKAARREHENTASSSSAAAAATSAGKAAQVPPAGVASRKVARTQIANKVNKIGAEVRAAAEELVYATDANRKATLRALLEKKKEELVQLKEEAVLMA